MRWHLGSALIALGALLASAQAPVKSAEVDPPTALPVFRVLESGLGAEEAQRLAASFGVPTALDDDGSFRWVSSELASVPLKLADASELPPDEDGQDTTARAFNLRAIRRLRALDAETALAMAQDALARAEVAMPDGGTPVVSNTMLFLRTLDRRINVERAIDTSVAYHFELAGHPVVGPGAKLRMTFSPSGAVTELGIAFRRLQEGEMVPLIPPRDAKRSCRRYYPRGSVLSRPELVYWAPPLEVAVESIYPHWQCGGVGPNGAELVPALLPAAAGMAPEVAIDALVEAGSVRASASVIGGTPPYRYSWQSSSTLLGTRASSRRRVSYQPAPRETADAEVVGVTVTDANDLVGKARVVLPLGGAATASRLAAAPDTVPRALNRLDVGGAFNVWDWQCVKESAAGFKQAFDAHGVAIAFRWAGENAWETDFRETSAPTLGNDEYQIDNVDLGWYTGHGAPGGFAFDNPKRDDAWIVPSDARFGNRDLEWLQLESCNVLKLEADGMSIEDRWAPTLDGLHILNGFGTTATCIGTPGGTAGRFSSYLFARTSENLARPPLKIRQAWEAMARDLEPAGKQFVSLGAIGPGWLTNYDDYFWGQGPVGPDIPRSYVIGYWWLLGTV